jgi:dienelactone hydrolase
MTTPQIIRIPAHTPQSFAQILAGPSATPRVDLRGLLYLPAEPRERVPLVLIAIGSLGMMSGREELYTSAFNAAGIAALIVDGNTPRSVGQTVSNQGLLPWAACVSDALFAFKEVRDHPQIDAERIALLGYSRGGFVAVTAHDERLQAAILGDRGRLAAHVALYPPCYLHWQQPQPSKAPLQMILGGMDDLAPARQGRAYAELIEAAGGSVEIIFFPEAHHSFDAIAPVAPVSSDNVSVRTILIEDTGDMVEVGTGIRCGNDWATFLERLSHAPGGRRGGHSGCGPLPRNSAVNPIVNFVTASFMRSA